MPTHPTNVALFVVRLLVVSLFSAIFCYAATWTVTPPGDGGDFNTIQAAINASANGDTIEVADGTYIESVNFGGKAITLVSLNGSAACFVDGSGVGPVFVFSNGEGASSIVRGFTIQHGKAVSLGGFPVLGGGGVAVKNSSPRFENCVITDNHADGPNDYGGALFSDAGNPTFLNCRISANSATNGGAIMTGGDGHPSFVNCLITGNTTSGTWAGAVTCYDSATFTNCVFYGNTGGGSAAIIFYGPGSCRITNAIIWGNSPATQLSGGSVTYTDVQGGYTGAGNINMDPYFRDPAAGDFRVRRASPCVDAGSSSAPLIPATDFEGNPRTIDRDGDGVAQTDMGAFEVQAGALTWVVALSDPRDFSAIQDALDDQDVANGDTVQVLDGTYTGSRNRNLNFNGKAITLVSQNGPAACFIDGGGMGPVFVFSNREGASSIVRGFTIQHGKAPPVGLLGGGGVAVKNSSPRFENCVITDNHADGSNDYGGGVFSDAGNPTFLNCRISGNSATNGGAIMTGGDGHPSFVNCLITGNTTSGTWAGAVTCYDFATFTNCVFYGNTGGGSAAIIFYGPGSFITNAIIWGNSPATQLNGGSVTYSDVQGGRAGTGNIASDPLFTNPGAGDFRLATGSPCIDSGTNSAPAMPSTDITGDLRTRDGNADGSAITDMGAFEYGGTSLITLAFLTASRTSEGMLVRWQTASEMNKAGFHVWRSQAAEGAYERLSHRLIGTPEDPFPGTTYWFLDAGAVAGQDYYYKLEDIDNSGMSTFHGPVQVEQGAAKRRPGH